MLKREYCYSLRLQRSHSTNATIIRDGCSRSLAQLRRKAHAKLKKNSVNLKCKLLQIFPTVVDKLLCPHGQIAGWNGGAICIPSNTVVRLKHSFWDETVFILCCWFFFFFLGGGGYLVFSPLFLNYTERAVAETVSTPPTLSSRDTWTHGETGMKSNAFTPSRGNAFPKSQRSFSPVSEKVNKPSYKLTFARTYMWKHPHLSHRRAQNQRWIHLIS